MRNKAVKFLIRILVIALSVCVVNFTAQTPVIFTAFADEVYTEATDDLKKDRSFNENNYPEVKTDYSISVIQIAEGVNKELFVYTYQPSGDKVTASSINVSTTINDEISYYNYKLQKLNGKGAIYKYKVKDFKVRNENTRYYCISSLFRYFNESIDSQPTGGNIVTEVSYAVDKQYCFGSINGKPYTSVVDIETIVVTDKFVGYVRYPGGFALYGKGACDSHFVAFDTDKPIEKLYEADVYYVKQKHSESINTGITVSAGYSERQEEYAYLTYTDKVQYTGPGIAAGTFRWERIEGVENFIANVESRSVYTGAIFDVSVGNALTDKAKAELKNKKWVLRFAETEYIYEHYSSGFIYQEYTAQTFVGEVTILRLKFETNGITYNLGVIDNKQSGSTDPVNDTDVEISLNNKGKSILGLILLGILVVIFAPLLPYVFKAVVWFVTLPFEILAGIIKLVKKRKRDEDD